MSHLLVTTTAACSCMSGDDSSLDRSPRSGAGLRGFGGADCSVNVRTTGASSDLVDPRRISSPDPVNEAGQACTGAAPRHQFLPRH